MAGRNVVKLPYLQRHGRVRGYNEGCRCWQCQYANYVYRRNRRIKKAQEKARNRQREFGAIQQSQHPDTE
jgi:hypothetical protein